MGKMADASHLARSNDGLSTLRPPEGDPEFIAALLAGGDGRLAIDVESGVNKYLCPPAPADGLTCASSCTASPITIGGFRRSAEVFSHLRDSKNDASAMDQCRRDIEARLLSYFGAAGLAEVMLCASGTDALLATAMILSQEQPGRPMTAILPQASETGSGVPKAARLREFDGPQASNVPLVECEADAVEIRLRGADGQPLDTEEIARAYTAAAAGVQGRPVIYLTHGTKTGLIAPAIPPSQADVIVDACQARIAPAVVARYLRNGWPVVVTGSKFFGGPAFSGAVLMPTARLLAPRTNAAMQAVRARTAEPNLGLLLRWIAALETIEAFAPLADIAAERVRDRSAAIIQGISAAENLVPMQGMSGNGDGWSDIPTIFTFAVRDSRNPKQLLTAAELRSLYSRLAANSVLLGQPVDLGRFGGLRIAIGARDLLPGASDNADLSRLFDALHAEASQ